MIGWLVRSVTRFVPRTWLHRFGVIAGRALALYYRGSRYVDPIDGYRYRKLLPYGRMQKRENALAPHSLSLERHRLIWLYLQRQLDVQNRSLRVLHMAPEWALMRQCKKLKNLEYTTADLCSPWATVHCDIQEMPFEDESFDLILCNHVLEHIPDDRLAMRELYRVLAKGGEAILLVPMDTSRETTLEDPAINTDALREKYYHQRDHLRLYGLDYADRLKEAGFALEIRDYVAELSDGEPERYALRREELLYVGRKR